MLHITSSDIAARQLKKTGLPGTVLPWRDSLHEGPVLSGVPLETLSGIRARHLADNGWTDYASAIEEYARRDRCLNRYYEHDEVILWFGNDLSDQLQLLQVLEWFSHQDIDDVALTLISPSLFPGSGALRGVDTLRGMQMLTLFQNRASVTDEQLAVARRGWRSFCSSNPRTIEELLTQDTTALPYLGTALQRHLEQFPAVDSGLCRTTRQILQAVEAGARDPDDVLTTAEMSESPRFLGENVFWSYVEMLTRGPRPLLRTGSGDTFHAPMRDGDYLELESQALRLTPDGKAVLHHRADAITLNGIDRWRGGVYLNSLHPHWRWDPAGRQLTRVESSLTVE